MKAIVYTSQTGSTERYAQMLSKATGVPAYPAKEASKRLEFEYAAVLRDRIIELKGR